jgi:phosphohistidine phosphatase
MGLRGVYYDRMKLYLVRHGKAEAGEDDRLRPLREDGREAVARIGARLRKSGVRPERIEHSGLVRAHQTAEILASEVGGEVVQENGLASSADVTRTAERLGHASENVMLVGHEPFMGRLAAFLLTGDADAELFHVRTGAVICLSDDEGGWTLEWFIYPGIS